MKQNNAYGKDADNYQHLADSILSLAPNIPLDSINAQESIKTQGIDRFLQCYAPELAEARELLSRLGKRRRDR